MNWQIFGFAIRKIFISRGGVITESCGSDACMKKAAYPIRVSIANPGGSPGWKGTPPMLNGNMIAMFVSKPILEEIEGVLTGNSSLALAVFSYRR